MRIELPIGDIVDRATILEIKLERIPSATAQENSRLALQEIARAWGDGSPMRDLPEYAPLLAINMQLWDVEDELRVHESEQRFDARFIELARSVYRLNDERARIKRAINLSLGSRLVEDKSYADSDAPAQTHKTP